MYKNLNQKHIYGSMLFHVAERVTGFNHKVVDVDPKVYISETAVLLLIILYTYIIILVFRNDNQDTKEY